MSFLLHLSAVRKCVHALAKAPYLTLPMLSHRTGVSGWIAAKSDYLTMWQGLNLPDSECYTLVWESKARPMHTRETISLHGATAGLLKTQTPHFACWPYRILAFEPVEVRFGCLLSSTACSASPA